MQEQPYNLDTKNKSLLNQYNCLRNFLFLISLFTFECWGEMKIHFTKHNIVLQLIWRVAEKGNRLKKDHRRGNTSDFDIFRMFNFILIIFFLCLLTLESFPCFLPSSFLNEQTVTRGQMFLRSDPLPLIPFKCPLLNARPGIQWERKE